MMERDEKREREEQEFEIKQKKQSEKIQRIQKFIPKELLENDLELGYFAELDATFKSTTDEIQANYLKKSQSLLKECHNPPYISYKKDKYIIKEMLKMVSAF